MVLVKTKMQSITVACTNNNYTGIYWSFTPSGMRVVFIGFSILMVYG